MPQTPAALVAHTFSPSCDLPLFAREDAASARSATLAALHPAPPRVLNSETRLSEDAIVEALFSADLARRRVALAALNDRMQVFGDLLTGRRTVRLASTAQFPDARQAGIPEAVAMSDTLRQRVDTRWLALFNVQDRRGEPWPGFFKIADLYHAITVGRYLPGERIKFGTFEKGEEAFEHFLYGLGLQWNMLEMQGRWERAEGVANMQLKWGNKLATLAYAILTAAGAEEIAYQTGASELERDIRTINEGVRALHAGLYTATPASEQSGVQGTDPIEEEIPEDTPVYLLFNSHAPRYEERVANALETRFATALGGGLVVSEVRRPVIPLGTPRVPVGAWWPVLPGRKSIFSVLRDLRFYDFTDPRIAGVGEGEVGWGAHVFLRGDAKQVKKLLLA